MKYSPLISINLSVNNSEISYNLGLSFAVKNHGLFEVPNNMNAIYHLKQGRPCGAFNIFKEREK